MEQPVQGTGRRKRRRIVKWLVWLAVLCLAYTGAWFAAANYATTKLEHAFDGNSPLAAALDCPGMRMSGFPLHIGLQCDRVTINDKRNGISGAVGALRSAAEIFRPGRVKWEVDSPAVLQTSTGLAASLEWESLRSSLSLGLSGVEQEATHAQRLRVNVADARSGLTFTSRASEGHTRLVREGNDLAAVISLLNLDFGANDQAPSLPPLALRAEINLIDQAGVLDIERPEPLRLRGLNGEIRSLAFDLGDGRGVKASGPIRIGEDGLINGTLKLEVDKVDGWRDVVIAAYPETKDAAKLVAKGLRAAFLGQNSGTVTLQITNGVVVLGFIPLGNIPAI